ERPNFSLSAACLCPEVAAIMSTKNGIRNQQQAKDGLQEAQSKQALNTSCGGMLRLLEQQTANIIGNQVSAPVDECLKPFMNAKGCGLCTADCLSATFDNLLRVDVQTSLQGSCCDENPSILSDIFCAIYETAAVISFIG
ncbi:hypothetical protein CHARACLAT_012617, partial [Characodon lateralis]|nr:hypothetical protein [Characodon lateralis]